DLKPGNILVTADGSPKLLDFGIAKVLDPGTPGAATVTGLALTPEYASPEQIRGGAITTASDIYALGVILYRVLTGHSPYRSNATEPYHLVREICDTEPVRPSAVDAADMREEIRRLLRGDLDSIVLKALRKQPEQRYTSAEQHGE